MDDDPSESSFRRNLTASGLSRGMYRPWNVGSDTSPDLKESFKASPFAARAQRSCLTTNAVAPRPEGCSHPP